MSAADIQRQICLPPALSRVSELVESKPQGFITGDAAIQAATLQATKYVFDLSLQREESARRPIAQLLRFIVLSTGTETRSQRKRKRSSPSPPKPPKADEEIWSSTPLESLHLNGMDDDQVWAQLELRAAVLCKTLKLVLAEVEGHDEASGCDDVDLQSEDKDSEGPEESDELSRFEDLDDSEDEQSGEDVGAEGKDGSEEEITELRDPDTDSEDDIIDLERPTRPGGRSKRGENATFGKQRDRHHLLDDGFFSLTDFNAETEEVEAKGVSRGRLGPDVESDDDIAEDDMDFFAIVDEVGATAFEEDDLEDGGEPYYRDFFDPPAHKHSSKLEENLPKKGDKSSKVRFHDEVRVKKIKSRGKGMPVAFMRGMILEGEDEDDDSVDAPGIEAEYDDAGDTDGSDFDELGEQEDDMAVGKSRGVIERLKDDLFAEDEEAPSQDLSMHEARQAQINAQIAELEAQNVAPKEWSLMGEATSRSRPVNSLLEEDLEFERAMKVVPVVTEERVSSLEEVIKGRILDNRFDDVIRRTPVDDKPFLPSRIFDLDDKKSSQSLAQIYEEEYSANLNGSSRGDDRDGKLKKEHEELDKMWEKVCHKLDALSNAHFTPKQPKATISTVSNLPTTTLESSLPTTQSTKTLLTPEEIFSTPSEIRSRAELTPTEKRTHRNKQRKARRKAKQYLDTRVNKFARTHKAKSSAGNVKKDKEKALNNIVKTGRGVTVVGKTSADLKRATRGDATSVPRMDGTRLKL